VGLSGEELTKQRAREEAVKAVDLTRDDEEGAGADADGDAAMGTPGEVISRPILTLDSHLTHTSLTLHSHFTHTSLLLH
jgi:hypothetical protein